MCSNRCDAVCVCVQSRVLCSAFDNYTAWLHSLLFATFFWAIWCASGRGVLSPALDNDTGWFGIFGVCPK